MAKSHWLVKQEPESYAWATFQKDGSAAWTGVRNFQARNNLRAMKRGDLVLYYHSVSEKQVVGVAKVEREAYADPTASDGDWSAVDLKPFKTLVAPVTLDQLKVDPGTKGMPLVRHTRLSVMPVTEAEYQRVVELAGGLR